MEFIRKGILLTALLASIESLPNADVHLYSDLINMVGREDKEPCKPNTNNNADESRLDDTIMQPLLLSQYTFFTQTPSCERIDITQDEFHHFNWSCFTTGSVTSRDINWMFVDCIRYQIVSIKCLDAPQVNQITNTVCNKDKTGCIDFVTSLGQQHVCSTAFEIKKTLDEPSKNAIHVKPDTPSTLDIVAYVTGAFIVMSFIVSVCIPTEKCKPTYEYEQDIGLRIPMEIYELYGQHYKPSARRKLKTAIARATGSIPNNFQYHGHFENVAVVSNSKHDLSLHSLSSGSLAIASRDTCAENINIVEANKGTTERNRQDEADNLNNQQLLLSPSRFQKKNISYIDEGDRQKEKSLNADFYWDDLYVQQLNAGITELYRGELEGALNEDCWTQRCTEKASAVPDKVSHECKLGWRQLFPLGKSNIITSPNCVVSDAHVMKYSGPRKFSLC